MERRVRVGIAGCGAIARIVHIPLLANRPDVEVTAFADPAAAAREAARRLLPRARGFDDLAGLLETDVDAVVVAMPTGEHAAAVRAVLAAGRDVYVEKPLAASLAEAAALHETWRAGDRIGMVGFNARFNPLILRLRALLTERRAGTPVYVRTVFSIAPREVPAWKRTRATGGGVLLDLAPHHIDLVRFLFDAEPVAVRATLDSRVTEDDTALLELELEGGLRVHSFHSLAAAELEQIDVHGDRARLSVSRFTSLDVTVTDNPGAGGAAGRLARLAGSLRNLGGAVRARRAPLREPGYAIALDRFLEGVRTRRLPQDAPDFTDGFAGMAVIDAAERSARSGRAEAVEASPVQGSHA